MLVDVFFPKQPSVNVASCSTGAVRIQAHVPNPTGSQIPSVRKKKREQLHKYRQNNKFTNYLRERRKHHIDFIQANNSYVRKK